MARTTKDLMQIGRLAERVDLSLRTVRYYEEVGLVVPSTRSKGGFRLYTTEQEARLLTIKQMKPLGFTLDEMRVVLDALDAAASCTPGTTVARHASSTLSDLLQQVQERRVSLADQLVRADALADTLSSAARRLAR